MRVNISQWTYLSISLHKVCVICLGLCYWFHIHPQWVWLERGPKIIVSSDRWWQTLNPSLLEIDTAFLILTVHWWRSYFTETTLCVMVWTQWSSLMWLCTSQEGWTLLNPIGNVMKETTEPDPQQRMRLPIIQICSWEWTYVLCILCSKMGDAIIWTH